MNSVSLDAARVFIKTAVAATGSYMGKAVVVIQANPAAVVAAVVVIAALIIGVVCYKAYKANQEIQNDTKNPVKKKPVKMKKQIPVSTVIGTTNNSSKENIQSRQAKLFEAFKANA